MGVVPDGVINGTVDRGWLWGVRNLARVKLPIGDARGKCDDKKEYPRKSHSVVSVKSEYSMNRRRLS